MDIAEAFEITTAPFRYVEPVSETAKQIVARTRRQVEQAEALGWADPAKALSYAEMNLASFRRGGVELEGAKEHARRVIAAGQALLAILDQVEA